MDEVEEEQLLEELHQNHSILSQALSRNQLTQEYGAYQNVMQGIKGGWRAKKLTVQILTKFYKYFPHLQTEALDCFLDLCESTDSQTRMFAIKFLPNICKEDMNDLVQVTYSLSQLLQLGPPDYCLVCDSLGHLFKLDPLNAVKGIFQNIDEIEEGALREQTLDFTYTKLPKIATEDGNKVDEILLSKARDLIKNCSTEEFMTLMTYMVDSKWAKLQGQEEIFQIIQEKIEINEPFEIEDIDRLDICVELIVPLFNQNKDTSKFVNYYCLKVLPKLQQISSLDNGDQYQIELLKQLTLMSPHCKQIAREALDSLLASLKEFIPVPPDEEALADCPNLELCHIECLLYTFHSLCKILPEFLENDSDKLEDLKKTLQYLTFIISNWDQDFKTKKYSNLRESLSQVDKIKLDLSVKIFNNLLEISKDFFNQPLVYKASVQLSFTVINSQIEIQETPNVEAPKRLSPITFDLSQKTIEKPPQIVAKPNPPTFVNRGVGNRGRGYQGNRGFINRGRGVRGRGGNWGGMRGQRGFVHRGFTRGRAPSRWM